MISIKNKVVRFKATNDLLFKILMKDKDIASSLTNLTTNLNVKPDELELINSENVNDHSVNVKTPRMDVVFNIAVSYILDLEMQTRLNLSHEELYYRIRYYLGRIIDNSISKGKSYHEGRKCIVIFFICTPFNRINFVEEIRLFNITSKESITDDASYIFDLTKLDQCDNMELRKWLEMIQSDKPYKYLGRNKTMDKAINDIYKINETSYGLLNQRELDEINELAFRRSAVLDGIEKNQQETIKKLLSKGFTIEEVSSLLDLSIDNINRLLKLRFFEY